jgi:hypothetical protein
MKWEAIDPFVIRRLANDISPESWEKIKSSEGNSEKGKRQPQAAFLNVRIIKKLFIVVRKWHRNF